eukprot:GHVT01102331.1.p1 GENE.GHVT01102331.1~~GHVT01102331.1.p1  ORF type:complete len:256 (-),score=18.06 GHVT01102331.1:578-1345(-)
MENVAHLINLRVLDLSFNKIRKIENISTLVNLEKLYLSSNKITKIENLETLTKLKLLELGENRIRQIEGIDLMSDLEELWLGKNKISELALPSLPKLQRLSIQSNRLQSLEATEEKSIFLNCPALQELYASHNRIPNIPEDIAKLSQLTTLDLAVNVIKNIDAVRRLKNVEELWLHDNEVQGRDDIQCLAGLDKLQTLYLERNPIHQNLGPGYRQAILKVVPGILQIDALLLNAKVSIIQHSDVSKPAPNPIIRR